MKLRLFIIGLLCSTSLYSIPAMAEDTLPAVAAPNGKVDASGGSVGREVTGALAGTYSMPLSHDFGFQIDGGVAKSKSVQSGGAAVHIFKRDPNSYLIGLTGMFVLAERENKHHIYRTGVESEFYLDDFTVSPSFGYQRSFGENWAYATLHTQYYITDNLVAGAELNGYSDYRSAGLDIEWKPETDSGMSLFASGGAGNEGGGFGLVGVRFSFGMDDVSLKRQHREYDPPNIVNAFTSGVSGGNGIAEKAERVETPAPAVVFLPS